MKNLLNYPKTANKVNSTKTQKTPVIGDTQGCAYKQYTFTNDYRKALYWKTK